MVSGAHQSISSGISGPIVSYDLSVSPWALLFSGRQGDWWLTGPYSLLWEPLPPLAILGALGLLGPMLVWPRLILIPWLLSKIVNPEGLYEALTSRGQRTSSVHTYLVPLSSSSSSASKSF